MLFHYRKIFPFYFLSPGGGGGGGGGELNTFSKSSECSVITFSLFSIGISSSDSLLSKNHGLPNAPLPIITPSAPVCLDFSRASTRVFISPLPKISVPLPRRFRRFTAFVISFQCAGTFDISCFVLACRMIAARSWSKRKPTQSSVSMVL